MAAPRDPANWINSDLKSSSLLEEQAMMRSAPVSLLRSDEEEIDILSEIDIYMNMRFVYNLVCVASPVEGNFC